MKMTNHAGVRCSQRGVLFPEIELVMAFCEEDHLGKRKCNRKACGMIVTEIDILIRTTEARVRSAKIAAKKFSHQTLVIN